MTQRILKDIRLYESKTENIAGQPLPAELGGIIKPSEQTFFIAKRIARKLNELNYSYGEIDHIYINLSTFLKVEEIKISNRDIDKRIKYIDFGIAESHFNALREEDKDTFIESLILTVMRYISDKNNLEFITQTALALVTHGRKMKIHFKTKETKTYQIAIYYQIAPENNQSKAIIEYHDKKSNAKQTKQFALKDYEDIYSLVDTITIKDQKLILKPKKSYMAQLVTQNYETPVEFELI